MGSGADGKIKPNACVRTTTDELVVSQQLEIADLKKLAQAHKNACKAVLGILYGVGGPLNDNYSGFTAEQMKPFFEISEVLGL